MNNNPNKAAAASQNDRILEALKAGAKITPMDALQRFGCFRLSARIADLRVRGYHINNKWRIENGKRFAEYHLEAN